MPSGTRGIDLVLEVILKNWYIFMRSRHYVPGKLLEKIRIDTEAYFPIRGPFFFFFFSFNHNFYCPAQLVGSFTLSDLLDKP